VQSGNGITFNNAEIAAMSAIGTTGACAIFGI
jgi:hypothetical protein